MEDHSAIPVLEDEAIQFDLLLVEPQDDHVSVDDFLCFHRNSSEKCMQMDDIPCKFGGINFGTDREQQHLQSGEVPDIKPHEIEAGEFQVPNGPSSSCEDYLLDGEFEESGIKLNHDSGIGLPKLVSGNHNQADRAVDHGTPQKSDSSVTTTQVDNCQGDLDVNDSESHGIFSCTADSDKSLEDRWFKYTTFTVENMEEDVSRMFSDGNIKIMSFTPGLTSGEMPCPFTTKQENEHTSLSQKENKESSLHKDASLTKSPIQASSIDNHDEKRLRKPPKRFIDELSEPRSKSVLKKREVSTPSSKGKFSNVRPAKHHNKKSRAERLFPEESSGIAIQVPFGPLVQKESRTNQVPVVAKTKMESCHILASSPNLKVLQSDKEASTSESEEENVAEVKLEEDGGGRRKHHILWTVSEVRRLIDGVSQYGVGRWSRIKKDLFSSSAHRTPVDLKDKWRNLLKASCAQRDSKRGEDRKRNLAWRPLPKSILQRVNELANIYPYPRDLRSKR